MKQLGRIIYTNAWGYKVCAVLLRDVASMRISVELYILSPKGEMSDIVSVRRSDFKSKKKPLDFIYNFEGGFTRDEIAIIRNKVNELFQENRNAETEQNRCSLNEIHCMISDFIKLHAHELEDNSKAEIFVKDGFGYMRTDKMTGFLKENPEIGYKRVEILKRLKIMGVLKNGTQRPYDIQVSVGNEKKRFYKVQLAEQEATEEKADEVIKIGN